MDPVNQPGSPDRHFNIYGGAALAGVVLMAVGIVGGVILKDLSVIAIVGTTLPGIVLLLIGIRGKGGEQT
jgi:hypothetical protein